MKRLFVVFIGLLILAACCTTNMRSGPRIAGVDKRVSSIYSEYIRLSRQKHIIFTRKIPVGFINIKKSDIVGMCVVTPIYREIVVDIDYWNNITKLQQLELLFHELTHCFCGRNHDYGGSEPYPEATNKVYAETAISKEPNKAFLDDGCPTSIMFPRVLSDSCIKAHYSEYTEEMFDRCVPF